LVALLAACSAPAPVTAPQPPVPSVVQVAPQPARPPAPPVAAHSIDTYKKEFAHHVAHANPAVFHDPLPAMFKSIVVLDVTIDRTGQLSHVAVHRSNGYKDLEKVALNSVRHAAPFAPPSRSIQRRDGSVNFLETFMFRQDGRFVIRTLADQA
jgi:protein TonB